MDKYEYKIRAEEIKRLVDAKQYDEAMEIADTIDWRRVKSIMMLTIVSDIYKINRRYEDSKAVLLLAYDRHPGGRTIVYSLCELSIKMEEFVQAWEYYKEFVQIAPKDTGRFILQYKLYEAQEVSIEERISVLEEFKKRDYREKWAYELAYLYHRIGLSTKCIEECDELILWFGEGKYVLKAMELKMLHAPLNPVQQDKYDQLTGNKKATSVHKVATQDLQKEEDDFANPTEEFQEPDMDIQVKTMDMSKYNTINLQKELAKSMKELLGEEPAEQTVVNEVVDDTDEIEELTEIEEIEDTKEDDDNEKDEITKSIIAPLLQETTKMPDAETIQKEMKIQKPFQQEIQEVYFEEGKTAEMPDVSLKSETDSLPEVEELEEIEENKQEDSKIIPFEVEEILAEESTENPEESQENHMLDRNQERSHKKTPEELEYERMVAQDSDGQISFVVPDEEKIEKQITGQMKIEDILAEWENTKKKNQEKRMEDVRKRVTEQTGQLFSEFDEATKTDLLAKLEEASKLEEENRRLKEENAKVLSVLEDEDLEQDQIEEPEPADETEDSETEDTTTEVEDTEEIPEEDVDSEEDIEETEQPQEDVLEEAEEVSDETKKDETEDSEEEEQDSNQGQGERELTEEEDKLFGSILHSRKSKRELLQTLDKVSLASYTGNILITGEEGTGTIDLAKNLMKDIQKMDSNFSGKVAKISAKMLNSKDPAKIIAKLENGALIIEKAEMMSDETITKLLKVLDQGNKGIIVLMEDTPKNMEKLLKKHKDIENVFNARINIPHMNTDALVNYAKQYAHDQDFSIDELGVLALYTRIADMQTSDHIVNTEDIEDIMEDAMYHATRKSLSHLKDTLLRKRYDKDDMIILREKDFINY